MVGMNHLKSTRPLWQIEIKSSTEGVCISSGLANSITPFEIYTHSVKDLNLNLIQWRYEFQPEIAQMTNPFDIIYSPYG
jgi:hypothetical protein